MRNAWTAGVCLAALATVCVGEAEAARRPALKCAQPAEVAAIQVTAVDQQLVDASLGCGTATENSFITYRNNFRPELFKADRLLLEMFKRVLGPAKGNAAYDTFKTHMAAKAEITRVHDVAGFCHGADLVLAAANGPDKPDLSDIVRGVQVADSSSPVDVCTVTVAVDLKGASVISGVTPKPRPPQPDDGPEQPLVVATAEPAPAPSGIKVGSLTCNVSSGFGFIFGSEKALKCTFATDHGAGEHYSGTFSKYGVDIGYADQATLVWGVVAPTSDMRAGSLEGDYAGATAGATFGIGLGANVLIGGLDKSIALQPLSVQGNTGLSLTAGLGVISLKYEP